MERGPAPSAEVNGPTLVTGARGFAGSHLVDRLIGKEDLAGWHRPGSMPAARAGLTWTAVDLIDREAVRRALAALRPARIYHLAGVARADSAWNTVVPHLQANVLGTHHLVEAVRTLGFPCRVLVVSSALVYLTSPDALTEDAPLVPATPYGVSKLAQDQLALTAWRDDGLDVVVARPFNHIGPRQEPHFAISGFAQQIARIEAGRTEPVIKVGNLDARRDLIDVRDVADAYERLMAGGVAGRVYNVCSGRAVRIGDVLESLVRLSTKRVAIVVDPARLRPLDMPVVLGSAARLERELGWMPRFTLDQTLRDTLSWWRERVSFA